MRQRVIIIGGGIVGLATAYRLHEHFPDADVTLLEKEKQVGQHQSSHNSGVLHCGLYYKPGSLRARLAVSGIRQMVAFCQQNAIPHEVCGKLVVASRESEVPRLRGLLERGTANGLEGLRWLTAAEIKEIEPHATGFAALHVPQEGIADYPQVCAALARKIGESGAKVATSARVQALTYKGNSWVARTTAGDFEGDFLINCAGLHCDRVSELAGERREMRIVPFRGEYYKLKPERQYLVRNLIYPVPDPRFPFLGVHFTRLIHGGIECGPNAVLAFAREGYRKTDFRAADLFDALFYRGFWRFLWRYRSTAWFEGRRSFSRKLFARSLQRLVPEIQPEDLDTGGSGVRAQAMSREGDIYQDFRIVARPNALHVLSAPSPAATASLAIGAEIVRIAADSAGWDQKGVPPEPESAGTKVRS
ncbi:MAG: L-2-hydroxyglutarate oxidase [Acidobacteriia bacterium]|nr:L-2-hydroxyglutarate oxidase [Terriglobia bacterium]